MLQWLRKNKEWMFCGIAVAVLIEITRRIATYAYRHTQYARKIKEAGISKSTEVGKGNAELSETLTEPSDHLQTGRDPNISRGSFYTDINGTFAQNREMIMSKIWYRAQEMLRGVGGQDQALRMKTAVSLLQYASLEEDGFLQERWAALLANATTRRGPSHAAFPEVLRQLTGQEIRFSDALYTLAEQRMSELLNLKPQQKYLNSVRNLGTPSSLYKLYCTAAQSESTSKSTYEFSIVLDNLQRCQIIQVPNLEHPQISFTAFGVEFITACRPPVLPASE
jgi:hypothetical protein